MVPEIFPAEINLSLVRDENGKGLYIQSIIRDISERKQLVDTMHRDRTVFHDLALRVLETEDITEFCQYALEYLIESLEFDFGTLRVKSEIKDVFNPLAVFGLKKSLADKIEPLNVNDKEYLASYAIRNKKSIFAPKKLYNMIFSN